MNGLTVIDEHALVRYWLTLLRDRRTPPALFRNVLRYITFPLALAAFADLPTVEVSVETPLTRTTGRTLAGKIRIAAILRAALGMVNTIHELVPDASIHHLDMHRNETTLFPVVGRYSLPTNCSGGIWFIPDPMLATGGSAAKAIELLTERGASSICLISVIAAPNGIELIHRRYPLVRIVTAVVDERLTGPTDAFPPGYIWPGLGDAGDRQFGTGEEV